MISDTLGCVIFLFGVALGIWTGWMWAASVYGRRIASLVSGSHGAYIDALVQIKAVRDIGVDFRDPVTGRWTNDAATERDAMYGIAIKALGLPAGLHEESRCHNKNGNET